MKIKDITILGALMLSMTSCSLFNKQEVKQEVILPQDREAINSPSSLKTYSSKELKNGIITGDWAIEEVLDKPAVGEKAPFLKFVAEENRMFGNNGCNTVNANYTYNPADSTLRFENVLTTMMMCGKQGITDMEVNSALNNTRFYSWFIDENNSYLYFYDQNHVKLMTLMHQDFDFLNGAWKVSEINGEKVNIDEMKLVFDVDEHKVHGNTGCNVLNGDFLTDMNAPNSVSFEDIAVTLMMCPQMEYQTALLVALEEAEKAKPVNKDLVVFLDSNDKIVLTLTRDK